MDAVGQQQQQQHSPGGGNAGMLRQPEEGASPQQRLPARHLPRMLSSCVPGASQGCCGRGCIARHLQKAAGVWGMCAREV
jgi:hypothetical protein